MTTTISLLFYGCESIGRPNSLEQILEMMLDIGFRVNMLQVGSFAYESFAFWREYDERARGELDIAYDKQQLSFVMSDNHSYIVSTVKIGWSGSTRGQPEQTYILLEAGSPTTMFTQKEHDPERHAQRFLEVGKRLYGLVRPTFGWIERCKPSGYTTWKDIENLVVPHIYWANFLGPAYVAKLGRDFLLKAPGWRTENLIDGGVLYVLSPSLTGTGQRSTVEQIRQHFGDVTIRYRRR